MSNAAMIAVAWLALAVQLLVGIVARQRGAIPLIPLLNLAAALGVLAYWGQRWYKYLFQGVIWYATDQLIPLYAILVCILAVLTLSGRYPGVLLNWLVYGVDTLVLLAAALFFSFFRINRLF
jgi:hypothetical protein